MPPAVRTLPNLGALDTAELYQIAARTRGIRPGRRNRLPNKVARMVNNYCWNLITARACRERGEIQTAQQYEAICEKIYGEIPSEYRW